MNGVNRRLMRYLRGRRREFGFSSIASLNFNSPRFREFLDKTQSFYLSEEIDAWPDYLRHSKRQRSDPRIPWSWVQSAVVVGVPFRNAPVKEPFLPLTGDPLKAGLIAGYGSRVDYHLHARDLMTKMIEAIRGHLRREARFEICVDVKPLAERALAAAAGLGRIGRNSCILCANEGGGCFIATLLTDLDLPDHEAESVPDQCRSCNRCRERCPNNVIKETPKEFDCFACRSHLTMSERGELTVVERDQLGAWIFGCDICSGACPRSKLPETMNVDLEWLLGASTADVKRAIARTPLEFAGIKTLRRNAIYVLAGKRAPPSLRLIKNFAEATKSDFLREIAEKELEQGG